MPLTLLAIFEAKPGSEKRLYELLHGLIAPSLKEDGCINYDLHTCSENSAKFMFHENWTSLETLDKHRQSPHMKTAAPKITELLATPKEVTVWKRIMQ